MQRWGVGSPQEAGGHAGSESEHPRLLRGGLGNEGLRFSAQGRWPQAATSPAPTVLAAGQAPGPRRSFPTSGSAIMPKKRGSTPLEFAQTQARALSLF